MFKWPIMPTIVERVNGGFQLTSCVFMRGVAHADGDSNLVPRASRGVLVASLLFAYRGPLLG
jgi:hypothetical protein